MTIREIDELIEEGNSLKQITQAYSEIANLKIKRIRAQVERNRIFFEEIFQVYGTVKAWALKKKVSLPKPKKRLCILLTSNYRFYGNINSSLVKYFIGSTRELSDIDRLVIGKGGVNYFRATKVLPNFKELLFKDDLPTPGELVNLVALSANYNQVLVFFSKLKSLLMQRVTFTDITATSFYLKGFPKSLKQKDENFMPFIFDPELLRKLTFFDNQILTLLLEQTFLESELSRTASRFISMDQAENEANKLLKEYLMLKAYVKRNMQNNRLLESIASVLAVRRSE